MRKEEIRKSRNSYPIPNPVRNQHQLTLPIPEAPALPPRRSTIRNTVYPKPMRLRLGTRSARFGNVGCHKYKLALRQVTCIVQ
jgi:hypothetical protein